MLDEKRRLSDLRILVAGIKQQDMSFYKWRICEAGFFNVEVTNAALLLEAPSMAVPFDLLVTSQECEGGEVGGHGLTCFLRSNGFQEPAVLIANDWSLRSLADASLTGLSDYWLDGPYLRLDQEVRLLVSRTCANGLATEGRSFRLNNLGFLRTCGLDAIELKMLDLWLDGFPRQAELAKKIERSHLQVRKSFSVIYDKMGVKTPAALASVLTILCNFGRSVTFNIHEPWDTQKHNSEA